MTHLHTLLRFLTGTFLSFQGIDIFAIFHYLCKLINMATSKLYSYFYTNIFACPCRISWRSNFLDSGSKIWRENFKSFDNYGEQVWVRLGCFFWLSCPSVLIWCQTLKNKKFKYFFAESVKKESRPESAIMKNFIRNTVESIRFHYKIHVIRVRLCQLRTQHTWCAVGLDISLVICQNIFKRNDRNSNCAFLPA